MAEAIRANFPRLTPSSVAQMCKCGARDPETISAPAQGCSAEYDAGF